MHENPGVWKNGGKIKVYDWGEDSLVGFEWLYGSLNNQGSRNSREQRAKKNPRGHTRVWERLGLSLPVSSQWERAACWIFAKGKILRNSILKVMFYKLTQIYLVRLLK